MYLPQYFFIQSFPSHVLVLLRFVGGPYNAAVYRQIDYHGFLHTTVPFVVRNLSRVFFYSMNIFNFGGSLVYNRQTIELADGSIIAIDWACLSKSIPITSSKLSC